MKHIVGSAGVGWRWLVCLAVIWALSVGLSPVSVAAAPTVGDVHITDVRDTGFVVSWTTDEASDGHVDYGTTTALGATASDPVVATTTHYVSVSGLVPNQTYYFRVRSGTTTDDNGGALYQVTTGPILGIPVAGHTAYGYVYAPDGTTPVPNAVVYFWVTDLNSSGSPGDSQIATCRTDVAGMWYYSFGTLRLQDASLYYVYTLGADQLSIVVEGGSLGSIGHLTDAGALDPRTMILPLLPAQIPDLVLAKPTAVHLTGMTARSWYSALSGPAIALWAGCVLVLVMAKRRA